MIYITFNLMKYIVYSLEGVFLPSFVLSSDMKAFRGVGKGVCCWPLLDVSSGGSDKFLAMTLLSFDAVYLLIAIT